MSANWYQAEPALARILQRQLGTAYPRALPRLVGMGARSANELASWAALADRQGPRLVSHDRSGNRIDEIEYHPAYRSLQQAAYGGGIVAASYAPELAEERGDHPRALGFGLGYLFAQAEMGLYCPVCMTDGAARMVRMFGTPAQQTSLLPRLAATDPSLLFTGAMFLTEKEAGSDVGQMKTVAREEGGRTRLYGDKWFCSNVDADVILTLARPEGAPAGTRGLGLYLLPRTLPDGSRNRYRIDRIKDKLGVRSFPTGEVTLEGAEAELLGGPGQGFLQMTEMLNISRLYNSVAAIGVLRRSLTEALAWSRERRAFGKSVIQHPLMTESLMDLACEQRGALFWVFRAVELFDRVDGGTATAHEAQLMRVLTPMLKYVTGRRAVWGASEAVEALGGNGYIEDWPMARVLRDAQVLPIWEGTSNILVLDTFRALRKGAHTALLEELRALAGQAPPELQSRLEPKVEELAQAFATLSSDPRAEHAFRDWVDRAALLWQVGLLGSASAGAGSQADLRAASRLLSRHLPTSLLRTDRATPEELLLVAEQD